jgi:uncharacterized protein DUF4154
VHASFFAAFILASAAIGQPPTEYEVKAAFLLNFARFVEWPPEKGQGPFVVAVLGEDPFGPALDRTFEGNGVGGRPSEVRRLPRLEDASRTQILFIGKSEERRLPAILAALRGTHVLTVSDIPGFAERGGMIGLRLEERRVRFDINPEPAAESGLKLSSQLLKLARIVSTKDTR